MDESTSSTISDGSSSMHAKRQSTHSESEVTDSEQIVPMLKQADSSSIDPKEVQAYRKLMITGSSRSSESFEEAVVIVRRINPARFKTIKSRTPKQETKDDGFPFNAKNIKDTYNKRNIDDAKKRQMLHEIKISNIIRKLKDKIDILLINETKIMKCVKKNKMHMKICEIDMKKLRITDIKRILSELQNHRGFHVYGHDSVGVLHVKYTFYMSWDSENKSKSVLGYRVLNFQTS